MAATMAAVTGSRRDGLFVQGEMVCFYVPQDPAEEFRRLRLQLLEENAQLAQSQAILILNKTDRLQMQQLQQVAELVAKVKKQTGIAEVHAVSGGSRGCID